MNIVKCAKFAVAMVAIAAIATVNVQAQAKVDKDVPTYKKTDGVSGSLTAIGSDTLANLMEKWNEGFKAKYPNVKTQLEAKGSSTAPPALTAGTSQLGQMSRAMKDKEVDAFEKKYGYKPTAVRVSIDALAVFVHKDNPVKSLTLKQIDGIFSSTRKRGGEDLSKWSQVGVDGLANISLYGRNSASGTYGFFKKKALKKGDYKTTVKEQPGSSGVIQGIAADKNGAGYSGIGYLTSGVKAVAVEGAEPTAENCINGKYKLARFLYIYVNKKPNQPLDKLSLEFLKFVNSQEGQQVVADLGFYPLPGATAKEDVAKISK